MADEDIKEKLRRARTWMADSGEEGDAPPQANALTPELAAFAARQKDFNARVHQELAEIPVPPTLRDQILARGKIVQPRFRWRVPALAVMTLAAALLVLAAGIWSWQRSAPEDRTFAGFRSRMIGFALREYRMDLFTPDMAQLKAYLARQGTPADFALPPQITARPLKGGAALAWQGKPVSMVCFESAEHTTIYLFVVDGTIADGPPSAPELQQFKNLPAASWKANGKTFLLSGKVPEQELKAMLPASPV